MKTRHSDFYENVNVAKKLKVAKIVTKIWSKNMNMISTAFPIEMEASGKQESLVNKLVAAWEKKNSKTARAGGVSLMALSLAACGAEDETPFAQSDIDTAVAAVDITTDNAAAASAAVAAIVDTTPFAQSDIDSAVAAVDITTDNAAAVAAVDITTDNAAAVTLALTEAAVAAGVTGTEAMTLDSQLILAIKSADNAAIAAGVDKTTDNAAAIDAAVVALGISGVATLAQFNTAYNALANPVTFNLTTGADTIVGGSGDNTINGGLVGAVLTIGSLDSIDGGDGADTLAITINGTGTSQPQSIQNVETVAVTFTAAGTMSLLNATGVTMASISSSTATSTITNLDAATNMTVSNHGDLTATFSGKAGINAATTGDSATLTLDGVAQTDGGGFSIVTVTGNETINVIVNTASTVDTLNTGTATTVNISGPGALSVFVDVDAQVTTVDGSNSTGVLTLSTRNIAGGTEDGIVGGVDVVDFTMTTGSGNDVVDATASSTGDEISISTGLGNDTVTIGSALVNSGAAIAGDTIAGGDGTDTLTSDVDFVDTAAVTTALTGVSGFETLNLLGAMAGVSTVTAADISTDLTRVNVSAITNNDLTLNMQAGASTVGLNVAAAITATGTLTVDAAGTGTADTLTITNMLTTGQLASATSDIVVTDYENVTINTGAYAVTAAQNIGVVNVGTAALTISGSNGLTQAAADAITAGSINASAMTGAFIMNAAAAAGVATISGGSGNDTLRGDAAGTINGNNGNDTIFGGTGNDTLNGNSGNDVFNSSTGTDVITGGDGNDTVNIGTDAHLDVSDTYTGGNGTDTFAIDVDITDASGTFSRVSGFEILEMNSGAADTVTMTNFSDNAFTRIDYNNGANNLLTVNNTATAVTELRIMDGMVGDTAVMDRLVDSTTNTIEVSSQTTAARVVAAITMADEELITFSSATAAADITYTDATLTDATSITITGAGDFVITNAVGGATALATFDASAATGIVTAIVSGSTVAMTATAGSGAFVFTSGSGSDNITGSGVADTIIAGGGNDVILGGGGGDTITGGNGSDTITTGGGADTIRYAVATTANLDGDTFVDFTGDTGGDELEVNTAGGAVVAFLEVATNLQAAGGGADGDVFVITGGTNVDVSGDNAADILALNDYLNDAGNDSGAVNAEIIIVVNADTDGDGNADEVQAWWMHETTGANSAFDEVGHLGSFSNIAASADLAGDFVAGNFDFT